MNRRKFEAEARKFDYSEREKDIRDLVVLREQFVKHFTPEFIKNMKLEDYCLGLGRKDMTSFCYAIEQTFSKLGVILGATAKKFGIYFSPKENSYVYVPKFGDTKTKAFNAVKKNLIKLLEAGDTGDADKIAQNIFSSMVKGKILSLYYPEKYLNIFSDDHLDHFIDKLGLGSDELYSSRSVFKRQALVDFKNSDSLLTTWEMDKFSAFLYYMFPIGEDSDELVPDTDYMMTVGAKVVEVERKHKKMQNAIYQLLQGDYKNLKMEEEPDEGSKDKVDIKGKCKKTSEQHFFEIKTSDAKHSIREALGQILEYANYPSKTLADKLYIVGLGKPTVKDKEYMQFLRDSYNIPVWYRRYNEKKNILEEEN